MPEMPSEGFYVASLASDADFIVEPKSVDGVLLSSDNWVSTLTDSLSCSASFSSSGLLLLLAIMSLPLPVYARQPFAVLAAW